jgi:hypothetical protein
MTGEIGYEYLMNMFVPSIRQRKENPVFTDEPVVLLKDSVVAPGSERDLPLLGENKIINFVFPAYATNLFPGLDFVYVVL